jgi:hypothetical protein
MKIKEIAEAMSGNTVWCRNGWNRSLAPVFKEYAY